MKRIFTLLFSSIMLLMFLSRTHSQSPPSYDAIADQIVNTSLKVRPGETVVINGSEGTMTLMHELFVAVNKAGGKAVLQMNIPEASREAILESPLEYLKTPNAYNIMQMRGVDCFVNLITTQDPHLFDDVPEERLAAVRQSSQALNDAQSTAHFRSVSLGQVGGIPTYSYAQSVGADHYEMLSMFWNAIDVDYDSMVKTAQQLVNAMKPGSKVQVTSPSGTNITFTLDDIGPRMNCGSTAETATPSGPASTWLPAGEAYSSVSPMSANGVIVVPRKEFRGVVLNNLKVSFKHGKISNMAADNDIEVLQKAFDVSGGMKDVLSLIDIGVNRKSYPMANYLSYEMGGVVTLGVGNNTWTGGNVDSDFGIDFHLVDTTVKVDGKTIVEKGKIK